ncbi:MAG: hypothetical protein IH898_14080 [Planctomycetes bacterium]|nr:hypothetical protein [Planctomycetota bacterium]
MVTYEQLLDRDLDWALREGSMHFEGASAVHKTLRRIAERLEQLGVDYAIAGGMALFFHGYRRFTEDVDVLVTAEGLQTIHANLEGRGYVKPFEKSKNLRDAETGVKIDFLISGQYPGDGKPGPVAFPVPADAATEIENARFLTVQCIVELKLASGKAAGRQKDLGDVQELIKVLNLPLELQEQIDSSLRDEYCRLWKEAQEAPNDD